MNYTKGEWKVAENTGVIVHNGLMIAHVALDDSLPIKEGISQRQANANLIAATPDMYETLKNARALLDAQVPRHPDDPILASQIEEFDKALAKAEGK